MGKSKARLVWELFCTFAKIGAFTFGGGYAMIPLIETEVISNKKWITEEDLLDMMAIAESTPGVLAVNSATFVGCKIAGFWGSAAATLGVVLPSFIIISVISLFLTAFQENKWVAAAFAGVRAGVVLLMVNAVRKLSKNCPRNVFGISLVAAAFLLAAFTGVEIVLLIIAGALIGIVYQSVLAKKKLDGEEGQQ